MKPSRLSQWLAFLLLAVFSTPFALAHGPADEMAGAARNFIAALNDDQKSKAAFGFKDEERFNWHFIPRSRKGLPLKEMTPAQRHLAYALLNSAMSQKGFLKTTTIMSLEQILHEMENRAPHRDAELYYFSIFGAPGHDNTWAWRVEGHHLSLNFTIVDGHHVSVTPSFFGTNPAEVRSGPRKGLRVLADEEDIARQLVQSLNPEQKKVGIYDTTAPADIITGADRKARHLTPMGIAMNRLNEEQARLLQRLIREYVYRYRDEVADQDLAKIAAAGAEKIFFAWAGSTEVGKGHYYRVQGPSFLIEYDNTQNNANHVHAVWRDLENDFGEDLLRKHYDEHPH